MTQEKDRTLEFDQRSPGIPSSSKRILETEDKYMRNTHATEHAQTILITTPTHNNWSYTTNSHHVFDQKYNQNKNNKKHF